MSTEEVHVTPVTPEPVAIDKLTPTQDLIMEVLAARTRLGESWWPFPNIHNRASKGLEKLGLADRMHGDVENTFRLKLTLLGKSRMLSPDYLSPLEEARGERLAALRKAADMERERDAVELQLSDEAARADRLETWLEEERTLHA